MCLCVWVLGLCAGSNQHIQINLSELSPVAAREYCSMGSCQIEEAACSALLLPDTQLEISTSLPRELPHFHLSCVMTYIHVYFSPLSRGCGERQGSIAESWEVMGKGLDRWMCSKCSQVSESRTYSINSILNLSAA